MKLLVLDGNSIFNRAFYGIKLLTTKEGIYTNAIYGFLTMLNKMKDEIKPDTIAIAFDMKAPTFRHKKYEKYKENRKGMPEELFVQFPILKELLTYLGYKIVEAEGFEADDILGTFAKACSDNNNECIIATGDRDSLQLVSKNVSVRIASTKFGRPDIILYDENKILEQYGVRPKELIEIKALQGDASDNIPGVPGIGQKGATELIQKFKNIDYIYENINDLDIKPGIKKKLLEGKDSAYLSRYLGTIVDNAPIDININNYFQKNGDKEKALELLKKLEMFSLIDKLVPNENISNLENNKKKEINVKAKNDLEALYKTILDKKQIYLSYYLENKDLKNIAFFENNNLYIIENNDSSINFIQSVLENKSISKVIHNIKPLVVALNHMNIYLQNVAFDTMLAAYLLNPSAKSYDVLHLASEYSCQSATVPNIYESYSDLIFSAYYLPQLKKIFEPILLERKQIELFKNIEIPFSKVLADMEYVGFLVDKDNLINYGETLQKNINELENEIYKFIGKNVNINSPKQLGAALFEDLALPHGKKTKNGYSTSAEVLEKLKFVHPVIDLILQYRTMTKLKSTYCDGMIKEISNMDGRIHSNFNQTETKTGRISSTEPNLQNIPVKTDIGKNLRKFFIAKDGQVLVDADYSQIELRILAHIANDKNMIEAFQIEDDIHTTTASQVFNIPIEMVTPLMRSRAKAVNFGIIYGMSAFSLAKDIGVTKKEADTYINSYFNHYSNIKEYLENTIKEAKEKGYVETIFNRRRYLPELKSSNFNLRSFGERVARNMPIQGTAADIIKIAMINISKKIKELNLKSKIILQVHDEIILEAPKNEAELIKNILETEMKNAVNLKVPLTATANIGENWYMAKG